MLSIYADHRSALSALKRTDLQYGLSDSGPRHHLHVSALSSTARVLVKDELHAPRIIV